jgi:hypothetical protein
VVLLDSLTLGDECIGEIDHGKAEIRLSDSSPVELQMATLLHEWVHGALVAFGYNKESQNEHLVDALATAINLTFKIKE